MNNPVQTLIEQLEAQKTITKGPKAWQEGFEYGLNISIRHAQMALLEIKGIDFTLGGNPDIKEII